MHLKVELLTRNSYWMPAEDVRLPERQESPHITKQDNRKKRKKECGWSLRPREGSSEGGKVPTAEQVWGDQTRLDRAEASEPKRSAQQLVCGRQNREYPAQVGTAILQSPAWDTLLSLVVGAGCWSPGFRGRSQGEDWDWLGCGKQDKNPQELLNKEEIFSSLLVDIWVVFHLC